jgi:hypothetical protein
MTETHSEAAITKNLADASVRVAELESIFGTRVRTAVAATESDAPATGSKETPGRCDRRRDQHRGNGLVDSLLEVKQ